MSRSFIATTIALSVCLYTTQVIAGNEEPIFEFDIQRATADVAINALAEQSSTPAIFSFERVNAVQSRALQGKFTLKEALQRTLEGTGLTGIVTADGVITVVTLEQEAEFQEGDLKISNTKKGLLGSASAVLASLFVASPGMAQEDGDTADNDVIFVTGSRIARPNLTAPTPVTSVGAAEIARSGTVDIADIVNEIPALALGQNRQNTNFGAGTAGINGINLRGLGSNRTLVLVDGRRHVTNGTLDEGTVVVDISSIPAALVERVDVITGGASAIYGADAVAGVVNFVMKDDFEGVLFETQAGVSGEGDAEELALGVTVGGNFDNGRGNVTIHASYLNRDPVLAADREFSSAGTAFVSPGVVGQTSPFAQIAVRDSSVIFAAQNTVVASGDDGGPIGGSYYTFNADGSVRPFDAGVSGVFGTYSAVGSELPNLGPGDEGFQIVGQSDRYLLNMSSHYDLSDNIRFFLDGKYARIEALSEFSAVGSFSFVERISLDNPFIPADLLTAANSAGVSSLFVNRASGEFGPRISDNLNDTLRIASGIEGNLGDDYTFELYYQYGSSTTTLNYGNDRFDARWFQALDVIADPNTGAPVCRDPSNGCVPVNIFGPQGVISPEAIEFVRFESDTSRVIYDQQVFAGHIAGPLPGLSLPAGPIQTAVGFEYRKEGRDDEVGAVLQDGLGYFAYTLLPVSGEYESTEFFAEVAVPVLAGSALAEELTIEGALRFADYSTVGSNLSWKTGALWTPVEGLTLRGTYSKAVRAPNTTELFAPVNLGGSQLNSVTDPCSSALVNSGSATRFDNCVAVGVADPNTFEGIIPVNTIPVDSGGNVNLTEETANTYTLGAIISPAGVFEGMTFTVDYYNIVIDDYIQTANGNQQNVLNACVDAATIDNGFCAQIDRDAAGNISRFRGGPANISRFETSGLDVAMNYQTTLGAGDLSINGVVGHVFDRTLFVGGAAGVEAVAEDQQIGELGNPKWRATANVVYTLGDLTLNVSERYFSKQELDVSETENVRDSRYLEAAWFTDIQAAYDLSDGINVYAGINNVFDNQPPVHPYTAIYGPQFGAGLYDAVGRYFYAGARIKF